MLKTRTSSRNMQQQMMESQKIIPKPTLHIEVEQLETSSLDTKEIEPAIHSWLGESFHSLWINQIISSFDDCSFLANNIKKIIVAEASNPVENNCFIVEQFQFRIYVYKLRKEIRTYLSSSADGEASDQHTTAQIVNLPCESLDQSWTSLHFEPDIKPQLLRFVTSMSLFAQKKVSFNCVSWNRTILLHGPPGNGKTSLRFARAQDIQSEYDKGTDFESLALAQKLAIRLSATKTYNQTKLVEINTRSLLSRWFSESGKLVDDLFEGLCRVLEDERLFVCLLIDEVESISSSRKHSTSANEPADAIRVVNSLLTGLDKLRLRHNVIVLATSNLIETMDPAFLDRVDLKQHIGPPSEIATYTILSSCLRELMRCGIVDGDSEYFQPYNSAIFIEITDKNCSSTKLLEISRLCRGLSGRALRRLPLLMHTQLEQAEHISIEDALEGLAKTVKEHGITLVHS